MAVYSLSIHADYRCRHSGQCCSVDWDVPVELPMYRTLTDALAAGRIVPASPTAEPFIVEPDLPDDAAAIFQRTDEGRCVFFERDSRLCVVHRDLGAEALPATCRHFPRLAVHDQRGTFVGLSHFCPTAAAMLFRDDVPVAIVREPEAFPPADYEGLTISGDDLPPLLHPAMLMDSDGYEAWEAHLVLLAATVERRPESVLATMARDARLLAEWRPSSGVTLAAAVRALPSALVEGVEEASLEPSLALYREAMTAVPDDLKPEPDEDGLAEAFVRHVASQWRRFHAPINRYIATKAFASWTAYQGRGVASIVRGIEAAVALVRVEAARQCRDADAPLSAELLLESFRAADFLLNHLAAGDELAHNWSAVEGLHGS